MRARATAVGLAVAFLLGSGSTAGARIVPGKSISGVRVGMSAGAVLDRIGAPSHTAEPIPGYRVWTFTGRHLTVQFVPRGAPLYPHGGVFAVVTRSRHERLPSGIGIGTSRRSLLSRVHRVRCPARDEAGIDHGCFVRHGAGRTSFAFEHGRVAQIEVGRFKDHPKMDTAPPIAARRRLAG